MATSRPQQPLAGEPDSIEWYGRLAQRLGGGLAAVAFLVAAVSGGLLAAEAGSAAGTVDRLVAVASADPGTLSAVAAVCHYGLLGIVVGTWFLGLGFILTGLFE